MLLIHCQFSLLDVTGCEDCKQRTPRFDPSIEYSNRRSPSAETGKLVNYGSKESFSGLSGRYFFKVALSKLRALVILVKTF